MTRLSAWRRLESGVRDDTVAVYLCIEERKVVNRRFRVPPGAILAAVLTIHRLRVGSFGERAAISSRQAFHGTESQLDANPHRPRVTSNLTKSHTSSYS